MDYLELIQHVLDAITPLFIGCTGGIVALILKNQRPPFKAVLAAACVSGFAGYIMLKFCLASGLNEHFTNAAVGLSGFFGPATLNALGNHVFKKLGVDLNKPDEKSDNTDEN